MNAALKKFAATGVKIGISAGLLGYLFFSAKSQPGFDDLVYGEKDFLRLSLALFLLFTALTLTICRWQLLARTLGLEFTTKDAFRVGFLGYAVNLMPLGLVGGDTVKAVFLARLNPTRKTEAVATVFVDRFIGLVALLALAAVGTLLFDIDQIGLEKEPRERLMGLCLIVQVAAVVGIGGLLLLFMPGFTTSSLWNGVARLPVVGLVIRRLVDAMHVYRGRADRLGVSFAMSLVVHLLFVGMIYLIGGALLDPQGRPTPQPRLLDHGVFVPIAMAAGTLPMGFFEWLLRLFYDAFVVGGAANKGFLIALVYRVVQVLAAGIGMMYYVVARGDVPVALPEDSPLDDVPEQTDVSSALPGNSHSRA